MLRTLIRLLIVITAVTALSGSVVLAQTASNAETPLLIPCDQLDRSGSPGIVAGTDCTIGDFFNQFIVLAQWGLTMVVVLGVLMVIYGGFAWITAGGRASKIEEGKRVIAGTVIGLMISFSAYVIINLTIGAITGTSLPAANPFAGPISTIFGGRPEQQPFSGTGAGINTITDCNTRWDNNCRDQIYCADGNQDAGPIHETQNLLNAKNCNCGRPDGCYGVGTAECVRRFQIANNLPPSGQLDSRTNDLVTGSGVWCTLDPSDASGAIAARVNSVSRELPKPNVSDAQVGDRSTSGCCVVYSGDSPLHCLDQVSARTCASLGNLNRFVKDSFCANAPETRTVCGFCHANNRCFGIATKAWCESKVAPALSVTFVAQTGFGNPLCGAGYIDSLRTSAP